MAGFALAQIMHNVCTTHMLRKRVGIAQAREASCRWSPFAASAKVPAAARRSRRTGVAPCRGGPWPSPATDRAPSQECSPDSPAFRSRRASAAIAAAWLRNDFPAGLAIAAVGLPSAIAYPAIAGLPPETGLYASIAPLVAYAVFGPSRQLIVGPDAATMTVLAGVLTAVLAATPGEADRVGVAAVLALVVGALYLLARLLRLGVLATFLSRPILTGFFAGVSLSILIGQIGRMTGVRIEAEGLVAPLVELAQKAGSIHLPTLLLAAAMFVLLQVVRVTRFPVPGPVVVVVVSVLLSALFDFEGRGIAVVGDIPAGLPALTLPRLAGLPVDTILLGAAAIFLVSFGAGIVTARSFGARGRLRASTRTAS